MRISAKADYAVRAAAELASRSGNQMVKADDIATAQHIPVKFLLNILAELKRAGIVVSLRGQDGGFRLARSPRQITVAEVIRAVEGPLASVHDSSPEDVEYEGAAEGLRTVWVALRANMRSVLEAVSIEDLARNDLPASVREMAAPAEAWIARL